MSQLLSIFRRFLFRRRKTNNDKNETKTCDNVEKVERKRTKSLGQIGPVTRETRAISVGRSGSIVIRNRSQTEILTVERKRVSYRSTSEKPTHLLNSHRKSIQVTAPTLLPSYRNRAASTTNNKSTVIYIKS